MGLNSGKGELPEKFGSVHYQHYSASIEIRTRGRGRDSLSTVIRAAETCLVRTVVMVLF